MLSFRLAIVTAAAGLCLWGLFSLLDSLQKPGLLRSTRAIVVKGCDTLESDEAAQQCPALLCQKALLDAKRLPLHARFEISVERHDEDRRVIAGSAYPGALSGATNSAATYFVCAVAGTKVTDARLVDREEFDELTAS